MENSNRIIKFRAWDKVKKLMLNNVSTGTITIWDNNKNAESKDCVFMQYTGLKDKNGKELFEGDCLGGVFEGCCIEWCNKCKSFQCFIKGYGCMACQGDVHWYELINEDFEIIGNIYENNLNP